MTTETRDRESILAELSAAVAAVEAVDARLQVAGAYEAVTARPGLWYRPVDAAATVYVVGCNGAAIGLAWPNGRLFGRWEAARFGADRAGPFMTGRAAAAALAAECGLTPDPARAA